MHREIYLRQQRLVVELIDAAKHNHFRTTLADATPREAHRCSKDLVHKQVRVLPSRDSEKELAGRFVEFFHSEVFTIRGVLDQQVTAEADDLSLHHPPETLLDALSEISADDLRKIISAAPSGAHPLAEGAGVTPVLAASHAASDEHQPHYWSGAPMP